MFYTTNNQALPGSFHNKCSTGIAFPLPLASSSNLQLGNTSAVSNIKSQISGVYEIVDLVPIIPVIKNYKVF